MLAFGATAIWLEEGVKGLGGQTFAPLAYAINAMVSKEPLPYFPVCVMSKEAFQKGKLAESTSPQTAYSPCDCFGYMAGTSAVKLSGRKRFSFWRAPTALAGISATAFMPRRKSTVLRSLVMTKFR
jgi:hypothetical protein